MLHILKRGSKSKHKRLAKNSDKDPTNKLTNWIQERNQMGSLRLSHTKELANNRCRTTESNYVFCNRSGCHNSLSPLKHCKPTRGDKREKKTIWVCFKQKNQMWVSIFEQENWVLFCFVWELIARNQCLVRELWEKQIRVWWNVKTLGEVTASFLWFRLKAKNNGTILNCAFIGKKKGMGFFLNFFFKFATVRSWGLSQTSRR